MAIDNYTPVQVNAGDCVGYEEINTLFSNLKSIYNTARESTNKIICQRVNETIRYGQNGTDTADLNSNNTPINNTSSVNDDTGCFVIQQPTIPIGDDPEEKKILALQIGVFHDYIITGNNDDSDFTIGLDLWVECDGERVWSGTSSSANFASFNCKRSSEILLCAETRITTVGGISLIYRGTTLTLCGGILCVQQFDNDSSTPAFFCPPCPLTSDKKPGRETLHLLYQNILTLCNFFQEGGQVESCFDFNFNDDLTHPLVTNVSGETTYLAIGQVTVCARIKPLDFATSAQYVITPQIGCQGEQSRCLSQTMRLSLRDDSPLPSFDCVSIPVFVCGTCQPGQTISAGFLSYEDCTGVPDPFGTVGENVEVTYIEQSYCLYTWEQVAVPGLTALKRPNPSCLDVDTFANLITKMDQLQEIVCDRTPINCFFEENKEIIPNGSSKLLQPAEAAPNPIPTGWPFPRKLTLLLDFAFCITLGTVSNPQPVRILAYLEITCGGNVIKTIGQGDTDPFDFNIFQTTGGRRRCSRVFSRICCNLTCPVDQPIEIRPVFLDFDGTVVLYDVELTCQQFGF